MAEIPDKPFSNGSNQKQETAEAVKPASSSKLNPIDKALNALTSEQRSILQWWRNENSEMTIATLGETGVGKSTLLNGLFGVKEFKEGDTLDPGTTSVVTHQYIRIGVLVTVHDCPGLLDGTGNESTYLGEMQTKTANGIDLMLYCISMKETRAQLTDDPMDETKKSAVTIVTDTFGADIWKNTMFVLTYANVFKRDLETTLGTDSKTLDQAFEDRISEWRSKIQQALMKNGVDPLVVNEILVKPAGYYKKRSLPGRSYWLSDLWMHALLTVGDRAKGAFLRLASDRLKLSSNTSEDDFKKSIEEQPIIIAPSMDILIRNMPTAGLNSRKTNAVAQSTKESKDKIPTAHSTEEPADDGKSTARSTEELTRNIHRRKSGVQKFFLKLWIKVIEILHLEANNSPSNLRNEPLGETWL